MEQINVDSKFIAAVYTIGAIVIMLDIMIWAMEGTRDIAIVGGLEFILVVTGTIMAFNKKLKVSRNCKKIIWFFSIMVAQALVAVGGLMIVVISFGKGLANGVGILVYVMFAARSVLIASASILIIKLHSTNENQGCPRIHIIPRIIIGIAGFVGVLTRCIYTVTRETLEELPFTIISWICIGCIAVGILLGYFLKVKETESKIL